MSRIESDFLGELEIPDEAYYGVQTMRGKHNFNITEMPMSQEPFFAIAYGYVKKASVMTNKELGCIPADVADALIWACDQIIAGKYNDQFVTDWLQGGAGTSTNMNCNEVLCNLACEHLGLPKGDKKVYPERPRQLRSVHERLLSDGSSTSSLILRTNVLLKAVEDLVASFYKKAEETKDVLKMGRTHLQDAVPMSFGQEFHGWGFTIADEIKTIKEAQEHLKVVNLGATAIGTTVTTHPEFPAKAVKHLAEITGIDFRNSEDLIAATSDCGSYVALSSAVKSLVRQAHEGLQRPPSPRFRSAYGSLRAHPSAAPAGFLHHAGQGQPRDPGSHQPGCLPRHWSRHDGHARLFRRPARTERHGTGHYVRPLHPDEGHDECL